MEESKLKFPANKHKYMELRKLMDILSRYGNVLVNGGVSAQERLTGIVIELNNEGLETDTIQEEIETLEKELS